MDHGKSSSEPTNSSSKNILEFLMLVGKLKNLQRTGWLKRNIPRCESVADHMYRMGVMTFLLDRNVEKGLDRTRCMKMALVHDMAECIVGDLTPFCGISKEEKKQRETDAMDKICALLDEQTKCEILELFKEYEDQETSEAKAVKDLDRFDMILQAFEYEKDAEEPNMLQSFFDHTEGSFQNSEVKNWVEELKRMRGSKISIYPNQNN